jgi:hypothetical protein
VEQQQPEVLTIDDDDGLREISQPLDDNEDVRITKCFHRSNILDNNKKSSRLMKMRSMIITPSSA